MVLSLVLVVLELLRIKCVLGENQLITLYVLIVVKIYVIVKLLDVFDAVAFRRRCPLTDQVLSTDLLVRLYAQQLLVPLDRSSVEREVKLAVR